MRLAPIIALFMAVMCVGNVAADPGKHGDDSESAKNSAPEKDSEEARVNRAREALLKRLMRAQKDGVVAMKGEEAADHPSVSVDGEEQAPAPASAESETLKVAGDDESAAHASDGPCLSPEIFSIAREQMGDDPLSALEALKSLSLSDDAQHSREIVSRLALSYLVIGFTEEAAATAASSGERTRLMQAIAAFPQASSPDLKRRLDSCGPVERLILGPNSVPGYRPLTEAEIAALEVLPPAMAVPLVERFALAAIDHQDRPSLSRLRPLSEKLADSEVSATFEFADLLSKIDEGAVGGAMPKLIDLAEMPGSHQTLAVKALIAASDDANADREAITGALEEAASQAGDVQLRESASLAVAKNKISAGKIFSGLTNLSRTSNAHAENSGASKELLKDTLSAVLHDSDSDKRIQGLAALAQKPYEMAASANEATLRLAAEKFANLGAVHELAKLDLATRLSARDADYWMLAAMLRAGDFPGAKSIALARVGDSRFAELIYSLAVNTGDDALAAKSAQTAAAAGDAELVARAAWRTGEWRKATAAYLAMLRNKSNPEAALHLALSALADGSDTAPSTALAGIGVGLERYAVAHFFAPAPNKMNMQVYKSFSSGVNAEISLMREKFSHD